MATSQNNIECKDTEDYEETQTSIQNFCEEEKDEVQLRRNTRFDVIKTVSYNLKKNKICFKRVSFRAVWLQIEFQLQEVFLQLMSQKDAQKIFQKFQQFKELFHQLELLDLIEVRRL